MRAQRSKSLLLVSVSFFAILLIIFTVQLFLNRSNERNLKAHLPLSPETSATKRNVLRFDYWKDRFDVEPRWNHFLQPPGEIFSEKGLNPKNDQTFWEEVREDLASIIREKFPELKLSQRDLQKLIQTVRILQKSMLELKELERTRSNREEIRKIRSEVNRALETFEEITQMSASDFILLGRPQSGIDNEKPDDEEIIEEYLDHSQS